MNVTIQFPGALNSLSNHYFVNDEVYWIDLLKKILEDKWSYLFQNDEPYNFILIYLNQVKISTLNNLRISQGDHLVILTAIAGG